MLSADDQGMWGRGGGLVALQEVGSHREGAAAGWHLLAGNDVPTVCEGLEQLTLIQRGTGEQTA